jgi:cobalamin biosynthesis Mg chelatase CobN
MSVIALLALACFPVFAHAECVSSSCVQYTEAIPKAEGGHTSSPHQKTPAKSSSTDNGGAVAPNKPNESEGSGDSGGSESSSNGGGAAANGNGGGTGQGKPAGSANGKDQSLVQQANGKGTLASQSSDSGASPLIPILIGIVVLAAISVGAVMYRQRRQRRGPAASAPSPKAS